MNFSSLVHNKFDELLKVKGFGLQENSYSIIYTGEDIMLSFSYDKSRSYGLSLFFYFNKYDTGFTLGEVSSAILSDKDYFKYETHTQDELVVRKWLSEVYDFLNENLDSIVRDSDNIFLVADKNQELFSLGYALKNRENSIISEIDEMWKKKDYKGIVALLNQNPDLIKGSIRLKYQYSLKR